MCAIVAYILVKLADGYVNILLTAKVEEEGELFFAECPELGYVMRGKSRKEAIKKLKGLLKEIIEDAVDRNVLQEILIEECGFKSMQYNGYTMYAMVREKVPAYEIIEIHIEPKAKKAAIDSTSNQS